MKTLTLLAALALVAVGFAAPASAHGRHVYPNPRVVAHQMQYQQWAAQQRHRHAYPGVRVIAPVHVHPHPYPTVVVADGWSPLGMLLGAGLGAFAGSHIGSGTGQLAAVGAGAFLGGLIGGGAGVR